MTLLNCPAGHLMNCSFQEPRTHPSPLLGYGQNRSSGHAKHQARLGCRGRRMGLSQNVRHRRCEGRDLAGRSASSRSPSPPRPLEKRWRSSRCESSAAETLRQVTQPLWFNCPAENQAEKTFGASAECLDGPIIPAINPPHLTRDLPKASWKSSEEEVESNRNNLKNPLIF